MDQFNASPYLLWASVFKLVKMQDSLSLSHRFTGTKKCCQWAHCKQKHCTKIAMFPFASFQYCFLNCLSYPFTKRLGTEKDYGKSRGHGIRQPWIWIPRRHKPLVQPQPSGVSFPTTALRIVPCMELRKTGRYIVELCSPDTDLHQGWLL